MTEIHKSSSSHSQAPIPPGTWAPARKSAKHILAPVERFLAIEASSGIVLMIAAAVALVWANSPWHETYQGLLHIVVGARFANFAFERDLHFWINDGLMTMFFFFVGLEIRREIHVGEFSEIRRSTLPLAAALGGMIVPALIYIALNSGRPSVAGWAIPMATDIAFAVGALALLGKRVAPALRILLLALAVIDDIGAIGVIAFFYSSGFTMSGFGVLGFGVLFILSLQLFGVRSPLAYVVPAFVVWAGALLSGIHPTLAGVIIAFMTPVKAWYGTDGFLDHAEARVRSLRSEGTQNHKELLPQLKVLKVAAREALSPADRLRHSMHAWIAFGIMPLFAFANAGVPLGEITMAGDGLWVFLGVTIGLAIGKPIGIVALSWAATKAGVASLPTGVKWSHVAVIGIAGGIGFTMSLFVAQLAFPPGPLLEMAKLGILTGSALAAASSLLAGYRLLTNG